MFWKKKRMIDVRELQRKGIIIIPKKDSEVVTDKDGFVELGKKTKTELKKQAISGIKQANPNADNFFGFMDSSPVSLSEEGYLKKEIDAKIERLDSLIYKLEQRIEVLERKAGVGNNPLW